jgi:hypothetical protein
MALAQAQCLHDAPQFVIIALLYNVLTEEVQALLSVLSNKPFRIIHDLVILDVRTTPRALDGLIAGMAIAGRCHVIPLLKAARTRSPEPGATRPWRRAARPFLQRCRRGRALVVLVANTRVLTFPGITHTLTRAGAVLIHAWRGGATDDYLEAPIAARYLRVYVMVETAPEAAAAWRTAIIAAGNASYLTILPPAREAAA